MEKNEIEKILKEKYDDEYTIKMFTNFVLEFQECFSDIINTEEVINRIKKNVLGNIVIADELANKKLDGRYAVEDGHFYLKKSVIKDKSYTKYLIFHEMLHAITAIRDENNKIKMLGFSYIKNSYGKGLNEAMTEYLAQIRNEKVDPNNKQLISGYRTIVEQMRRLMKIIGDKEIKETYFYNPEALKALFEKHNMNYDELELAYWDLCGKDEEVKEIINGRRLKENQNYTIHRSAEAIFQNYSKAIGKVSSLEDFRRKYQYFQEYVDGNHDCIATMWMAYYKSMGKDVDKLLQNKVNFNDIKNELQKLNINLATLTNMYRFSKCFVDDKNESAIRLYSYYRKNPRAYEISFKSNYGAIYDHFMESNIIPNDYELYFGLQYPYIGLFLKDHPEMDYSEVSYDHIKEKNSNINMFIFNLPEGNRYGYTIKCDKIPQYRDEEGNEIFRTNINNKCSCDFIYQKDGGIRYNFNAKNDFDLEKFMQNVSFSMNKHYSEKENLENFIEDGLDKDGSLAEKLNLIKARAENRRNREELSL